MQQSINQPIVNSHLPESSNLKIYMGDQYRGLPTLKGVGPYVLEYLERTYDTIEKAVRQYPRLLAIRFDLRYPEGLVLPDELMTSIAASRFVEFLEEKIKHLGATLPYERADDTVVRCIWAIEFDQPSAKPHYHFLLLLNRDAFDALSSFTSGQNLHKVITEAWASALGLSEYECQCLANIPESACYAVNMNRGESCLPELFSRASYLCKVVSKRFGEGHHTFGNSPI